MQQLKRELEIKRNYLKPGCNYQVTAISPVDRAPSVVGSTCIQMTPFDPHNPVSGGQMSTHFTSEKTEAKRRSLWPSHGPTELELELQCPIPDSQRRSLSAVCSWGMMVVAMFPLHMGSSNLESRELPQAGCGWEISEAPWSASESREALPSPGRVESCLVTVSALLSCGPKREWEASLAIWMCLKSSVNVQEESRKGREDGEKCYYLVLLFEPSYFLLPLKCPNIVTLHCWKLREWSSS